MKTRRLLLLLIFIISIVAGTSIFGFYLLDLTPDRNTFTIEAGEMVPTDPDYYVSGSSFALERCHLDLSGVQSSKIGTYEASVHFGWNSFTFQIQIVDTTAPQVSQLDTPLYLATGRSYEVQDLVDEITDNSGDYTITMEDGSSPEDIIYNTVGPYSITFLVQDASGNQVSATVDFTVDTAPTISVGNDYYVALGTSIDPTSGANAQDAIDGDVNDSLVTSIDKKYLTTPGSYSIEYTATDSNGLQTTASVGVTVTSKHDLEELIGSRTISRKEYRILGVDNLYDSGVSSSLDITAETNYLLPVAVHLYAPINSYSWAEGSGFIIDIDEEYLYICTCKHVTENADIWTAYFYDGTKAETDLIYESSSDDIAIAAIPLDEISDDTLTNLMTVHINLSYWGTLSTNRTGLFMNILGENGLEYTQVGNLINVNATTPAMTGTYTQYQVTTVAGNSGSGLFDGYGNLMGMVKFITLENDVVTGNYAVRLPDIVENYEELTGNNLYTY